MSGADIPITECNLILHQPSLREISYIGEKQFFIGAQCLSIQKNMVTQDETVLDDISNFHIFMTMMTSQETIDKKKAVQDVFQLIFPKYKISILPRGIYITYNGEPLASIDENNFEILQSYLGMVFCLNVGPNSQANFNPADENARRIAEKLMRGRRRVAAQNGSKDQSILDRYISILAVGLGSMSLKDCLDLTLYQMFDLIERYNSYTEWDIDIKSRLAGAKPEGKPKNWMDNIH